VPTVLLVDDKEKIHAPAAERRPSYREQMDAFERNLLRGALVASGGNRSEAARRLRLNRVTFYDRLRRHGLTLETNRG
jgi:DNA-binding NtrC family response regulator